MCYRAGCMKIVEKWLEFTKIPPKCSLRLSCSRLKYTDLQKNMKNVNFRYLLKKFNPFYVKMYDFIRLRVQSIQKNG